MSAAADALTELRARILSGTLPAGTKLHQAGLARELGMSRIPIRDALRQLASEGLVLDKNRTAVVAPVSLADLSELYELRLALEPRASALATERIGEADLARMKELLSAMDGAGDNRTWLELHDRFHAALYRASGRPRMIAILDQTRTQTRRYTGMRLERDLVDLNLEHRLILGAVERGEAQTVRRLLEAHLSSAWSILEPQMETRSDEDSSLLERIRALGQSRREPQPSMRHTRSNRFEEEVVG